MEIGRRSTRSHSVGQIVLEKAVDPLKGTT